ncbi:MAG: hypothetical protein R3F36_03050 [Candidatus Competibacteraceae bacterium]
MNRDAAQVSVHRETRHASYYGQQSGNAAMNPQNTTIQNTVPSSVSDIVLLAKRLEIDELKHLQSRAHLVGVISHMVHALQAERGASSIYTSRRAANASKRPASSWSVSQSRCSTCCAI